MIANLRHFHHHYINYIRNKKFNQSLSNGFITNVCVYTLYMIECVACQPHCQMLFSHVDSCEPNKFEISFIYRDRDHHLKAYKSVIPASKLVEWLVSQVT